VPYPGIPPPPEGIPIVTIIQLDIVIP